MKDSGEFFVWTVIAPGEGIGDCVVNAAKPLTVFPYSVQQVLWGVKTSHFEMNRIGSSLSLMKFVFFGQPSKVMLSVMESV